MASTPTKMQLEEIFTSKSRRIGVNIAAHRRLQSTARASIARHRFAKLYASARLLQGCARRQLMHAYIASTVYFAELKNRYHSPVKEERRPASLEEDIVHIDAILDRAFDIMLYERNLRIQKNQRLVKTAPSQSVRSRPDVKGTSKSLHSSSVSSSPRERLNMMTFHVSSAWDEIGEIRSREAVAQSEDSRSRLTASTTLSKNSSYFRHRPSTTMPQIQRKRFSPMREDSEKIMIREETLKSLPAPVGTEILKQTAQMRKKMEIISPTKEESVLGVSVSLAGGRPSWRRNDGLDKIFFGIGKCSSDESEYVVNLLHHPHLGPHPPDAFSPHRKSLRQKNPARIIATAPAPIFKNTSVLGGEVTRKPNTAHGTIPLRPQMSFPSPPPHSPLPPSDRERDAPISEDREFVPTPPPRRPPSAKTPRRDSLTPFDPRVDSPTPSQKPSPLDASAQDTTHRPPRLESPSPKSFIRPPSVGQTPSPKSYPQPPPRHSPSPGESEVRKPPGRDSSFRESKTPEVRSHNVVELLKGYRAGIEAVPDSKRWAMYKKQRTGGSIIGLMAVAQRIIADQQLAQSDESGDAVSERSESLSGREDNWYEEILMTLDANPDERVRLGIAAASPATSNTPSIPSTPISSPHPAVTNLRKPARRVSLPKEVIEYIDKNSRVENAAGDSGGREEDDEAANAEAEKIAMNKFLEYEEHLRVERLYKLGLIHAETNLIDLINETPAIGLTNEFGSPREIKRALGNKNLKKTKKEESGAEEVATEIRKSPPPPPRPASLPNYLRQPKKKFPDDFEENENSERRGKRWAFYQDNIRPSQSM